MEPTKGSVVMGTSRSSRSGSNGGSNSSNPSASSISTMPNGAKKKVYPNGSTYIGALNEKGRRHGKGIMLFKDGKYEGGWKNGKQHGRGKYVWNSGSTYDGYWKTGKFDGMGTYTWPSGAAYMGTWTKGKKNGQGTFIWANGTKYEGAFVDDKKNGIGEYVSGTDGTRYFGEYVNEQMEGWGTYLFPDGARFVGQFKNNNFDGVGTYTTPDGTCYVGQFKNDQRHGVGLLKPPHLGVFKVRYLAGKIVEHQDVVGWLRELGCEKYVELFQKEDITFDVLAKMTESDLQKLGISEYGKRRKLVDAIAELPRVQDPDFIVKHRLASAQQSNEVVQEDMAIDFPQDEQYADLGDNILLAEAGDGDEAGVELSKESSDSPRGSHNGHNEEGRRSLNNHFLEGGFHPLPIPKYREIKQNELRIEKRPIGRRSGEFRFFIQGRRVGRKR
eukprot:TRINITY_DN4662_c0_g1_i5.p1 TRINITY_DN4662_c0_g1~~TRINITY_DN4662_c0_g1_i5.p1  ORF type:complete len:443 (+),score=76.99 TRINITY_DN4662_c0_g1_i5:44-1372(+)